MPAVSAPGAAGRPRIVVTVGTDHHPFTRLVGWTNDWLQGHPELLTATFVQSGTARVKPACAGSAMVEAGALEAMLDAADTIVCHGGPASIAAAWGRGHLPIVVPRRAELGEHVDDHQVDFCRKLAESGRIRLAQTPAAFTGLLDEAAGDPARFRTAFGDADVDAAVARFGDLVEELVSRPKRRPLSLPGRRSRRPARLAGERASLTAEADKEQG
jgi:UDP-N-acetylglucosamine transferase subunit ALG13